MNGSSTPLIETGFEDYISENRSGSKMVHDIIPAENNDNKRAELRKKSVARNILYPVPMQFPGPERSQDAMQPAAGWGHGCLLQGISFLWLVSTRLSPVLRMQ
jgi:hypothetical protein